MTWTSGLALLAGLAAIYLLLPQPRPYPRLLGAAAGAAALLLAGMFLVRTGGATPETVLFYFFSGLAITAGALLITQSQPARAALSFALVVLSTCGLFLLQAAPFLMAATIIIYAGAIIVTFLFVLMLAQQEGRSDADLRSREPFLASAAGFALLGALLFVVQRTYWHPDTLAVLAELDSQLAKASAQTGALTGEQMVASHDWNHFFEGLIETRPSPTQPSLREVGHEPRFAVLEERINALEERWLGEVRDQSSAEKARFLQTAVAQLQQDVQAARRTLGDLAPERSARLSSFSGPPANSDLAHELDGHAPLPADNVAFLGRGLFTDYLLAVEVGGTLLLVATIGAIAIATRREGRRS